MRDESLIGLHPDSDVQILVDHYLSKAGRTRSRSGTYRKLHTLVGRAEAGGGDARGPSDGWTRGANHKQRGAAMDSARGPVAAYRVSLGVWDGCNCSALAVAVDVAANTATVNGPAELGLAERREATLRALEVWPS